MMTLQRISLSGDKGKHENNDSTDCSGRAFDVRLAGSGGAYAKQVSCTTCGREFVAWDSGLGAQPLYGPR